MLIRALVLASLLGKSPVSLGKSPVSLAAPTAKCEFHCKVRANVCLSANRSSCKIIELLPDETTGLCVFQSMQVAQEWINHQLKSAKTDWTLNGAECVSPDDNQI